MKIVTKNRLVAFVFGSGGARGWAHVGVLKAMEELEIRPDIVVGTSIGSIAAAVCAAGRLPALLEFADDADWYKTTRFFMEFGINKSGLVEGRKIVDFLKELIPVDNIEDLSIPYASVAMDLHTAKTVVFDKGNLATAIRASISIPGIFTPVHHKGKYLVDGGVVNPLPICVAKNMGARHITAVNINGMGIFNNGKSCSKISSAGRTTSKPNIFDVLTRSFRIAEEKITQDCINKNPPDLLIEPDVSHISTMDFHKSREAIDIGYRTAMDVLKNGFRNRLVLKLKI